MDRTLLVGFLTAAATFLGALHQNVMAAPPDKDGRRDVVVLRHCTLEYEQSTFVSGHSGTGTALPLQDCLVQLGDRVKAGQVLGRLFDRELRVQFALRTAEAESDIQVRVALSKRDELAHKLKRIEKLRTNGQVYASEEEHETARVLFESAQLMIEDATYKRRIAKIESSGIEAELKIREIVAPHDGFIVEVFKRPGETVVAGQPVFQVVDAERLRVTAYSNLSDYTRIRPGQRIEVALETEALGPGLLARSFAGKVIFVDKRIDAKSQTCRIVAQVDNQDLALAAGLEVRMTIYTGESASDRSDQQLPVARPARGPIDPPLTPPATSR